MDKPTPSGWHHRSLPGMVQACHAMLLVYVDLPRNWLSVHGGRAQFGARSANLSPQIGLVFGQKSERRFACSLASVLTTVDGYFTYWWKICIRWNHHQMRLASKSNIVW